MAKKIEDQILDKKTKEEIKTELLEVINTKVKDEIVTSVVNDVKEAFDEEYKKEIREDISRDLIIEIKDDIRKEQNKLTRKKSFKIFRLHIYILALLALVGYLVYLLYNNGGLDILNKYKIVKNDETTVTTTTAPVKDSAYYISNYGYLVDSFYISNLELLKGSYTIDNIDIADKIAMIYPKIAEEDIKKEGIIYSLEEEIIKKNYINVFGENAGYRSANFNWNGLNYAYQESTKTYIAIDNYKNVDSFVNNSIISASYENGLLKFTCYVGFVKNNQLYNVFNVNEALGNYESESSINNYKDSLSIVEYSFKEDKGNYYLYSIAKK